MAAYRASRRIAHRHPILSRAAVLAAAHGAPIPATRMDNTTISLKTLIARIRSIPPLAKKPLNLLDFFGRKMKYHLQFVIAKVLEVQCRLEAVKVRHQLSWDRGEELREFVLKAMVSMAQNQVSELAEKIYPHFDAIMKAIEARVNSLRVAIAACDKELKAISKRMDLMIL